MFVLHFSCVFIANECSLLMVMFFLHFTGVFLNNGDVVCTFIRWVYCTDNVFLHFTGAYCSQWCFCIFSKCSLLMVMFFIQFTGAYVSQWCFVYIPGVFIAHGDVGVGTIVGSAVFNILFVIGLCGVLVNQVSFAYFTFNLLHWQFWVTVYMLDTIPHACSAHAWIYSSLMSEPYSLRPPLHL